MSVYQQAGRKPWRTEDLLRDLFASRGVYVRGYRTRQRAVCEAENCPDPKVEEIRISPDDRIRVYEILLSYPLVVEEFRQRMAKETPAGPAILPDTFTLPVDAPDKSANCDERRRYAIAKLQGAFHRIAATACTATTDCHYVAVGTECDGSCTRVVHQRHGEAFATLRANVDAQICRGFRDAGCKHATPRCTNIDVACKQGRCVAVPR